MLKTMLGERSQTKKVMYYMYYLLQKALENTNLTYSEPNQCILEADGMGLRKDRDNIMSR